MKLFFDTEFTGLHKKTSLISIGIVSENGRRFYGEFSTYRKNQCSDWICENVLKYTILGGNTALEMCLKDDNTTIVIGSKADVRYALKKWLEQFSDVQFVSDVCHYDFVLLIDIFGTAFDLPKNVSPVCYDINQDIAKFYNISDREAFDMSREYIITELCGHEIIGNKHNALYDAEVIKDIYQIIEWLEA